MPRPHLPFDERFHDKILRKEKTCTARNKAYGGPGDVVDSPVGPLRILNVNRVPLAFVRDEMWQREGVSSPQEFEDIWIELHPGRGFKESQLVHLHDFEVIS